MVGMCQALVASGSAAVGDEAREDLARNTCKVAVAVVERDATLAASASAPEACPGADVAGAFPRGDARAFGHGGLRGLLPDDRTPFPRPHATPRCARRCSSARLGACARPPRSRRGSFLGAGRGARTATRSTVSASRRSVTCSITASGCAGWTSPAGATWGSSRRSWRTRRAGRKPRARCSWRARRRRAASGWSCARAPACARERETPAETRARARTRSCGRRSRASATRGARTRDRTALCSRRTRWWWPPPRGSWARTLPGSDKPPAAATRRASRAGARRTCWQRSRRPRRSGTPPARSTRSARSARTRSRGARPCMGFWMPRNRRCPRRRPRLTTAAAARRRVRRRRRGRRR